MAKCYFVQIDEFLTYDSEYKNLFDILGYTGVCTEGV